MSGADAVPIDQHNVEIERNAAGVAAASRCCSGPTGTSIAASPRTSIHRSPAGSSSWARASAISAMSFQRCVRTDLFANPWIDQVENAYRLTFGDGEVSHLILFDVFHHLQHPRTALRECRRVARRARPRHHFRSVCEPDGPPGVRTAASRADRQRSTDCRRRAARLRSASPRLLRRPGQRDPRVLEKDTPRKSSTAGR